VSLRAAAIEQSIHMGGAVSDQADYQLLRPDSIASQLWTAVEFITRRTCTDVDRSVGDIWDE